MAWANPDNINTANLDANTDSPALARADIKTAFDELRNVANNSKVSWTPAYNLTAGTVTFTYNTQQGNYIEMGDIVFFEFNLDADVLVSDTDAFNATVEVTGLPFNPSTVIAPVHITIQEFNNWNTLSPDTIRIQTTGNKAYIHSSDGTLFTGGNMSTGVQENNVRIKVKGWYFK